MVCEIRSKDVLMVNMCGLFLTPLREGYKEPGLLASIAQGRLGGIQASRLGSHLPGGTLHVK